MVGMMMFVDPALGKITKEALSQQTLMELFIDGIENKEPIYEGDSAEIAQWSSLCMNDQDEVIEIRMDSLTLCGSIDFKWLPNSVRLISVEDNTLHGSLDLQSFPPSIRDINVMQNSFEGTIALTDLPHSLVNLNVLRNKFWGDANLEHLHIL